MEIKDFKSENAIAIRTTLEETKKSLNALFIAACIDENVVPQKMTRNESREYSDIYENDVKTNSANVLSDYTHISYSISNDFSTIVSLIKNENKTFDVSDVIELKPRDLMTTRERNSLLSKFFKPTYNRIEYTLRSHNPSYHLDSHGINTSISKAEYDDLVFLFEEQKASKIINIQLKKMQGALEEFNVNDSLKLS